MSRGEDGQPEPEVPKVARMAARVMAYSWAAPTTAVGLFAGVVTLASGGRAQVREGAIEFHGGFSTWMLRRVAGAWAMTLGHVILGRDTWALDVCRKHEHGACASGGDLGARVLAGLSGVQLLGVDQAGRRPALLLR